MSGTSAMKIRHASKTAMERRLVVASPLLGSNSIAAKKSVVKIDCLGFPGAVITRSSGVVLLERGARVIIGLSLHLHLHNIMEE